MWLLTHCLNEKVHNAVTSDYCRTGLRTLMSWNGKFSALLAICAGNSPATGEFPTQRPVTQSFGVLFDLHLNERLNKKSWGCWFETPSRLLWHHSNVVTRCAPLPLKPVAPYDSPSCAVLLTVLRETALPITAVSTPRCERRVHYIGT